MSAKKQVMVSPELVESQLDGFIAKFEPPMQVRIREVRKALRKRLPTAIELVYDNYNFFVIGYCSTERASDAICSLVADKKGVVLAFYYGVDLEDPEGLLLGSGNQNRFVRLGDGANTLKVPGVAALLDAAVANGSTPLPEAKGYAVVRSVSAKQRPRR